MLKPVIALILVALALSWAVPRQLQAAGPATPRLQIALQFATGQPDTPVFISSSTTTEQQVHADVTITNRSTRRVTAVTMGVLLSSPRYQSARYLLTGIERTVALDPGATTSLNTSSFFAPQIVDLVATMTKMGLEVQFGALNEPDVAAELGVLWVAYDDGTSWTFNPVAQGGFGAPRRSRTLKPPERSARHGEERP